MKEAKQAKIEKKKAAAELQRSQKAIKAELKRELERKKRLKSFKTKSVLDMIKRDLKLNLNPTVVPFKVSAVDYMDFLTKNEISATSKKKTKIVVEGNLKLKNYHGSVYVSVTVYPDGGVVFRAVFDKIEKTYDTLNLINAYNGNNPYYSAFIRDDGFLELRGFTVNDEVEKYKDYVSGILFRFVDGLSDDFLLQLLRYTYL